MIKLVHRVSVKLRFVHFIKKCLSDFYTNFITLTCAKTCKVFVSEFALVHITEGMRYFFRIGAYY